MPGRLVLVKHSHVDVIPGTPARTWRLSAEGRRRAALLADRLRDFQVARILSSIEPKAVETAAIVAAAHGVPLVTVPGLHEHARERVPYLGAEEFEAAVARLFAEPGHLVFGEESADAAATRFAEALVGAVGDGDATDDEVVVAHGTVTALHVSRVAGVEAFPLWRSLGLPSYVVLSDRTVEVVSRIV